MKARLLALACGLFLVTGTAYAGPLAGSGPDSDGDGVDNEFDNCTFVPNATQTDTDHNGCGNACTKPITCDSTGDKAVGAGDFLILGMNFGMTVALPGTSGDCDGDGVVGTSDFLARGREFGNKVGPSGIVNAQCSPATCQCTPQ